METPGQSPITEMPGQSSLSGILVHGHVFLDGKAIGGVAIEAVSANGTDRRSTVTGDNGSYVLNITPNTSYDVTATYQRLRHTIWPVYLPGEIDTFDINLTTTPTSTIEGSGYTIISVGPWESKEGRYKTYNHTRWGGFLIEAKSTKDNTTVTAITHNDGSYSLRVEPNVAYSMAGYFTEQKSYPMFALYYRNYCGLPNGFSGNITVSPNETVLVDYVVPMP